MPESNHDRLKRHAVVEAFEPRLLMTGTPIPELQLEGRFDAPADGHIDPEAISPAVASDSAPQPTTAGIYDLVGWTSEQTLYGLTGVGQTVAVIDTGVAYDHPALGGGFGAKYHVVGGWDFAENDANPYDDGPGGGHGTHVSGIIGS